MSKEGKEIEIEEDFIQSSGELLRQARLGKELSITEISRKTRISKSMVQYLTQFLLLLKKFSKLRI